MDDLIYHLHRDFCPSSYVHNDIIPKRCCEIFSYGNERGKDSTYPNYCRVLLPVILPDKKTANITNILLLYYWYHSNSSACINYQFILENKSAYACYWCNGWYIYWPFSCIDDEHSYNNNDLIPDCRINRICPTKNESSFTSSDLYWFFVRNDPDVDLVPVYLILPGQNSNSNRYWIYLRAKAFRE